MFDMILKNLHIIIPMVIALMELIVRMTPTEKDDGFVQRIGDMLRKLLDMLKVPNLRK